MRLVPGGNTILVAARVMTVIGIGLCMVESVDAQIDQAPAVPYDSSSYKRWTDEDGDCQSTRQEVLIAESLVPVEFDSSGCLVVRGVWFDRYTALTLTDPAVLDIDHLVPLAEAHRSGADRWTNDRRVEFANDLSLEIGLVAVSAAANRSKSDSDPANWLPPNESYWCDYVRDWVIVKSTWGLAMDLDEKTAVQRVLQDCRTANSADSSMSGPSETAIVGDGSQGEQATNTGVCTSINTANRAKLEAVSGIGPSRAQAIIDYRHENGSFENLDELIRVSGIGEATLQNLKLADFCVP